MAVALEQMTPMMGADDSIPIFTASAPMSDSTASICARTKAGGTSCTPCTPTEFCAVSAVTTEVPKTRNAEKVLRSAWIPAPPPESEPAMVSAFGTVIDPESIRAAPGASQRRLRSVGPPPGSRA